MPTPNTFRPDVRRRDIRRVLGPVIGPAFPWSAFMLGWVTAAIETERECPTQLRSYYALNRLRKLEKYLTVRVRRTYR